MNVRSRGGWLRRVIASGATIIVALGVVLVAPAASFAADPPSISISRCGDGGGSWPVSGQNMPVLASGQFVRAEVYAPDGTSLSTTDVDVSSTFHSFFKSIPLNAQPYRYVKLVAGLWHVNTDPDGHGNIRDGDIASTYFVVSCGSISPFDYTVQQQDGPQQITVTLTGYAPGKPVTLSLPGVTVTPGTVTPTAAAPAPLTVDLTLDKQPACGDHSFSASQAEGDGGAVQLQRVDDMPFTVMCPDLTVNHPTVPDIGLPTSVTVSGGGWFPNGKFDVALNGATVTTAADADGTGRISSDVLIGPRDCGPQTITVTQQPAPVIGILLSAAGIAAAAPGAVAPPVPHFAPIDALVKTVTVQVVCVDPGVAVDPALLVERLGPQELTVRPSDFRPGRPIQLSLPGTVITPSTITPDPADPGASVAVTLDHQPACGANTMTARQEPFQAGQPAKVATTAVYVVCPRLTLDPPNVTDTTLPDPVTVHGTGWVPNVAVKLSYDGTAAGEVTPGTDGTITQSTDIPQSDCGKHVIDARQLVTGRDRIDPLPRATSDTEVTQQAVLNVDCSTPFLTATPQAMVKKAGAQKIAVRISGFLQGLPVTLAVPGTVVTPATLTPSRTDPGSGTVTLGKQPACGTTTMTATQVRTGGEFPVNRAASVVLTVFCPDFAVNPATVPDTALPGKVGSSGKNWVPNMDVQVLVDHRSIGTVKPGDTGVITAAQLSVPRSACGAHVVEAVQVVAPDADPEKTHLPVLDAPLQLRATATLTVACTPAFLSVDPPVVGDGNTTVAAGVGFTPGRSVQLTWAYLDGTPIADACTTAVSPGGTFLVTCLVLPNSPMGPRLLKAVETVPPGDPVRARFGQADLLVVPGSMTPKHHRFLERR
ncbi:MAG: hypothetical protein JWO79_1801 [Actinomycetia bacterium]|nr:hypothetical protein [Actinomycetes bacterium]